MTSPRRGILLDRDGTLVDVVRDAELGVIATAFHPNQLKLLPGVVSGLHALQDAGFLLAVATNQPGAAKGQVPRAAIERTNAALTDLLATEGVHIAHIEVCFHHPEGGPGGDASLVGPCACRKPKGGMIDALVERFGLDRGGTWMIGDSSSDVEAARAAGVKAGLLFDPRRCELCPLRAGPAVRPDVTGTTLVELARAILGQR